MSLSFQQDSAIKALTLKNMPRPIKVIGAISAASAERFVSELNIAAMSESPVVIVEIDSGGGDVQALFKMIDSMRLLQKPIATVINGGRAMSAAAILFCYGTTGYRFISPNASFMLHDVSTGMQGKVGDLEASLSHAKLLNRKLFHGIAERAGFADREHFLKKIKQRGRADWYLEAEEVVAERLADHIGIPRTIVKIEVDIAVVAPSGKILGHRLPELN